MFTRNNLRIVAVEKYPVLLPFTQDATVAIMRQPSPVVE